MIGGRADIVRRTHRFNRTPGFCLSQYPNNLFLAESTSLHVLLLFEQNSSYVTSTFSGSGQFFRFTAGRWPKRVFDFRAILVTMRLWKRTLSTSEPGQRSGMAKAPCYQFR
jgi:hypothetical protein